jgi:hypothetical protein
MLFTAVFGYQSYLITYATMAQKAGRNVWFVSVPEADAGAGQITTPAHNNAAAPGGVPMTAYAPQTGVVQHQQV